MQQLEVQFECTAPVVITYRKRKQRPQAQNHTKQQDSYLLTLPFTCNPGQGVLGGLRDVYFMIYLLTRYKTHSNDLQSRLDSTSSNEPCCRRRPPLQDINGPRGAQAIGLLNPSVHQANRKRETSRASTCTYLHQQ